jgi:hypothetical protein
MKISMVEAWTSAVRHAAPLPSIVAGITILKYVGISIPSAMSVIPAVNHG